MSVSINFARWRSCMVVMLLAQSKLEPYTIQNKLDVVQNNTGQRSE